jgi:hypothetical protein
MPVCRVKLGMALSSVLKKNSANSNSKGRPGRTPRIGMALSTPVKMVKPGIQLIDGCRSGWHGSAESGSTDMSVGRAK